MDANVLLQLVITAGTVLGGMFVTIRYNINQNNKEKRAFLEYLEKSQTQQLDYYANKNGIIEKISETFSKSVEKSANKTAKAIEKLATELRGKVDKKIT